MVFEDIESPGEIAGVKEVDVVVFVGGGKVERLHWVPFYGVGAHGGGDSLEGGVGAEVVESEGTVATGGEKQGGFRR